MPRKGTCLRSVAELCQGLGQSTTSAVPHGFMFLGVSTDRLNFKASNWSLGALPSLLSNAWVSKNSCSSNLTTKHKGRRTNLDAFGRIKKHRGGVRILVSGLTSLDISCHKKLTAKGGNSPRSSRVILPLSTSHRKPVEAFGPPWNRGS